MSNHTCLLKQADSRHQWRGAPLRLAHGLYHLQGQEHKDKEQTQQNTATIPMGVMPYLYVFIVILGGVISAGHPCVLQVGCGFCLELQAAGSCALGSCLHRNVSLLSVHTSRCRCTQPVCRIDQKHSLLPLNGPPPPQHSLSPALPAAPTETQVEYFLPVS